MEIVGEDNTLAMKSRKQVKIEMARKLRINQTFAEEILWNSLRARKFFGVKFRRQYVFVGFILDFYCSAYRLGIELDGEIHNKQKEYDQARDRILKEQGIKVIRLNNKDIINKLEESIEIINNQITILANQKPSNCVLPLHKMERETEGEA